VDDVARHAYKKTEKKEGEKRKNINKKMEEMMALVVAMAWMMLPAIPTERDIQVLYEQGEEMSERKEKK
jgi:hypothetical protein